MTKNRTIQITVSIFFIGLLCCEISHAGPLWSTFRIDIEMAKEAFEIREPLEGQVIITYIKPHSIPAVFQVELYHNGERKFITWTSIERIFPGRNKYTFKTFVLPLITENPASIGHWRLKINQLNVDDQYAAQAEFDIIEANRRGHEK